MGHSGESATVLLVEDDDAMAMTMAAVLRESVEATFDIHRAADPASAKIQAAQLSPDLIICDLTLAGRRPSVAQGLILCHELKSMTGAPVLVVSGSFREGDNLIALKLAGADDFLSKDDDFNVDEFRIRAERLLRRGAHPVLTMPEVEPLTLGPLAVDQSRQTAGLGSEEVHLTPIELRLLVALVRASGKLISRQDLAQAAWADPARAHGQAIDMHLGRLREKLHRLAGARVVIWTARGAGYRLQVGPGVMPDAPPARGRVVRVPGARS
jgi:two-component system, OmpR family, KDP operon response regulator KdpE